MDFILGRCIGEIGSTNITLGGSRSCNTHNTAKLSLSPLVVPFHQLYYPQLSTTGLHSTELKVNTTVDASEILKKTYLIFLFVCFSLVNSKFCCLFFSS